MSQLRKDNGKSKTASPAIALSPQNLDPHILCLHCCWLCAATWQTRLPEFSLLPKKKTVKPYPKSLGGHHLSTPHLPNNPSSPSFFLSPSPCHRTFKAAEFTIVPQLPKGFLILARQSQKLEMAGELQIPIVYLLGGWT